MMKHTVRGSLPIASVLLLSACATTGSGPEPVETAAPATVEPVDYCTHGRMQSPIDITRAEAQHLMPVEFHYRETMLVPRSPADGRLGFVVRNGGHITLYGSRYALSEVSLVAPGEHTRDGQTSAMELQLLHQARDGQVAAVGLLLDEGAENAFLAAVAADRGEAAARSVRFNLNDILPATREYFAYVGSLTTPPCTENVRWVLLKEHGTVSAEQREWLNVHYPASRRPIQQRAGRGVYVSSQP